MNKRIAIGLFIFSATFCIASPNAFAAPLKAPTIISPTNNQGMLTFTPTITGVAENNSKIILIVDDKIVGSTKVRNGKKGVGNFALKTKKLNLGTHTVSAVAEKAGVRSGMAMKKTFTIPKDAVRPLDGTIVPLAKYRSVPVGVMIENLPVVRNNQRGLSEALVVYETLAEGGATRFLALFDGDNIKASQIMPVRSTRPYYVQWAKEYGAVLMHAGGSPDGIAEIGKLRMTDADFLRSKTAKYFWRTTKTASVHNVATSNQRIASMLTNFGKSDDAPTFRSWKFKSQAPLSRRGKDRSSVTINFGAAAFRVDYRYNRSKNVYERWNGGLVHKDKNTNKQLSAKNVIIQYVPKEKVLDRKGRLSLKTTGTGKAILFQDGKVATIQWTKSSASGRTVFKSLRGKEIEFNVGSTWIEVVPSGKKVSIKK